MSGHRSAAAPRDGAQAAFALEAEDGVRRGEATQPAKSAQAFRTISEVSEELDIPAHVLRFWETKFPALTPMKRGGGRRYYRPADLALLRGIRILLYGEGLTIKGLQKMFRERGARHVIAIGEGGACAIAAGYEPVADDAADDAARDGSHSGEAAGAPCVGPALDAAIARLERLRDRLRAAG